MGPAGACGPGAPGLRLLRAGAAGARAPADARRAHVRPDLGRRAHARGGPRCRGRRARRRGSTTSALRGRGRGRVQVLRRAPVDQRGRPAPADRARRADPARGSAPPRACCLRRRGADARRQGHGRRRAGVSAAARLLQPARPRAGAVRQKADRRRLRRQRRCAAARPTWPGQGVAPTARRRAQPDARGAGGLSPRPPRSGGRRRHHSRLFVGPSRRGAGVFAASDECADLPCPAWWLRGNVSLLRGTAIRVRGGWRAATADMVLHGRPDGDAG